MNVLIIKLGATGDVVRTTPLLSHLSGQITWLTAANNTVLLEGLTNNLRCFSWEERARGLDTRSEHRVTMRDRADIESTIARDERERGAEHAARAGDQHLHAARRSSAMD